MKTFTKLNDGVAPTKKINVDANSLGYLTVEQLKKYLDVAKVFLKSETKDLIQWLIVNNDSFTEKLDSDEENVLAGFYNAGKTTNAEQKQVYNWIKTIVDDDRYLEIPVFLTQDQFDKIVSNEVVPDRIFYQLDTPEGKNIVAKKFEPLMHKLCHQWYGKLNMTYDDLMSVAHEGFVYAINSYGKKNKKSNATDNAVKTTKFGQYAAWAILNHIRGLGVQDSHIISISPSQLKRERMLKGFNLKSHSVSGDKTVGTSGDEGKKTLFDFIDAGEDSSTNLEREEILKLWKEVFDLLEKKFDKKHMDMWYSYNELNGHKKMSNKEIAKKYNIAFSNVTYYIQKVSEYIRTNKKIMSILNDINELTNECLQDEWRRNRDVEPYHVTLSQNNSLYY